MPDLDEQQLTDLIAALAPAPDAWVKAAQALPAARQAIDSLVTRAQADCLARERILADLEESLRREGVDPGPAVLEQLRTRLAEDAPS